MPLTITTNLITSDLGGAGCRAGGPGSAVGGQERDSYAP